MKTKFLIIIGTIIAITISVSALIIIDNIESQSKFPHLTDETTDPDPLSYEEIEDKTSKKNHEVKEERKNKPEPPK